jgi:hypothetical protein
MMYSIPVILYSKQGILYYGRSTILAKILSCSQMHHDLFIDKIRIY